MDIKVHWLEIGIITSLHKVPAQTGFDRQMQENPFHFPPLELSTKLGQNSFNKNFYLQEHKKSFLSSNINLPAVEGILNDSPALFSEYPVSQFNWFGHIGLVV